MEDQTNYGSGDKTLDNLVVIMAGILFFGTAQVMSTHAPQLVSDIVGFDASYLFGVISAICVEWGALRLHFNPYARNNNAARWVKWILLGLSGLCQVYNAAMETGTMASLSETLKLGFVWLVPNVPLLFIVLQFWIGQLSPTKPKTLLERVTDVGVLNMLPKWDEVLHGKHGAFETSTNVDEMRSRDREKDVRQSKTRAGRNGRSPQEEEQVNPK